MLGPLFAIPTWAGEPRLPLLGTAVQVTARAFVPERGWPSRIGALVPVGALTLSANDPAFGGFSALAIDGAGVMTLLSDGGTWVRIRIAGGRLETLRSGNLPAGPGTGWLKADRDSESLTVDPATGRMWVGFERANEIWRYAPDFAHAEARAGPRGMRAWKENGGAESLVRLRDGRFLALPEATDRRWRLWRGLLFSGDPNLPGTRVTRFGYRPPRRFVPSDAAELPGGDLLVLNRRYRKPLTFSSALVRIPAAAIRTGGESHGRVIATLGPDVLGENAEGLAVTRENGTTMVWIVTDNDGASWRPTILAKFRLE